jgi:hypothetical protein
MDISNISNLVKYLLKNELETRDNDQLLVIRAWKLQLQEQDLNPDTMALDRFFKVYLSGKLSNHESITRCRRKLQEIEPELRGYLYNQRQEFQTEAKKQIKEIATKADKPLNKIQTQVREAIAIVKAREQKNIVTAPIEINTIKKPEQISLF